MTERYKPYSAVWLVLIKDGKILLSRRHNTGWMDGHYTLVSGHLEANESLTQAMVREAVEEAGVIVAPENLKVVHINHRKASDREYIDVYFTPTKWSGEPRIMEPHICDAMELHDLNSLPPNLVPNLKDALNQIEQKNFYGEFGW